MSSMLCSTQMEAINECWVLGPSERRDLGRQLTTTFSKVSKLMFADFGDWRTNEFTGRDGSKKKYFWYAMGPLFSTDIVWSKSSEGSSHDTLVAPGIGEKENCTVWLSLMSDGGSFTESKKDWRFCRVRMLAFGMSILMLRRGIGTCLMSKNSSSASTSDAPSTSCRVSYSTGGKDFELSSRMANTLWGQGLAKGSILFVMGLNLSKITWTSSTTREQKGLSTCVVVRWSSVKRVGAVVCMSCDGRMNQPFRVMLSLCKVDRASAMPRDQSVMVILSVSERLLKKSGQMKKSPCDRIPLRLARG